MIILLGNFSCSVFKDDDFADQSHIDYLFGVEESGRLKKELHFSGSNDETVNSDIEFVYKNDRLIKKIYNDYNWNEPFVLQKDTFVYVNGKLSEMLHYFRRGAVTSPLIISEIYKYSYPDDNSKIEVIREETGELDDSVKYIYSGNLVIEERHFNHQGEWGRKFEYNSMGKLYKSSDLDGTNLVINYFDENGVLESSASMDSDGVNVLMLISYEREIEGNKLKIKKYLEDMRVNSVEPFLTSHKVFENEKLVEEVKYHPTFSGSQWYCNRYEYN